MNESVKNSIYAVINTLDQIEVKGEDNLDMLLACIRTLKSVAKECDENA
jgi:hypothetical protein